LAIESRPDVTASVPAVSVKLLEMDCAELTVREPPPLFTFTLKNSASAEPDGSSASAGRGSGASTSQTINVTDNNFDGVAPFTNGGITADLYTDVNPYVLMIDNVIVSTQITTPPVIANAASQVRPSPSWLGRVLNAMGEPIDGKGPLAQGPSPMPYLIICGDMWRTSPMFQWRIFRFSPR